MQNKFLKLGRSKNNDIVFSQGDVSGSHATITYLGDNQFQIEDLNSTNGTYVNGYRINKAVISSDDKLTLSANIDVNVPALFGITVKPKEIIKKANEKDFTEEFAALEPMYLDYKKKRAKITSGHNKKLAIIRGAITFSPMLILMLFDIPKEVKMQLMGIMILGSTAAAVFTSNMSPQEKLEELDISFRVRYVCPNEKCQQQLNGQAWALLHATGFCPRCGAIYNKAKL